MKRTFVDTAHNVVTIEVPFADRFHTVSGPWEGSESKEEHVFGDHIEAIAGYLTHIDELLDSGFMELAPWLTLRGHGDDLKLSVRPPTSRWPWLEYQHPGEDIQRQEFESVEEAVTAYNELVGDHAADDAFLSVVAPPWDGFADVIGKDIEAQVDYVDDDPDQVQRRYYQRRQEPRDEFGPELWHKEGEPCKYLFQLQTVAQGPVFHIDFESVVGVFAKHRDYYRGPAMSLDYNGTIDELWLNTVSDGKRSIMTFKDGALTTSAPDGRDEDGEPRGTWTYHAPDGRKKELDFDPPGRPRRERLYAPDGTLFSFKELDAQGRSVGQWLETNAKNRVIRKYRGPDTLESIAWNRHDSTLELYKAFDEEGVNTLIEFHDEAGALTQRRVRREDRTGWDAEIFHPGGNVHVKNGLDEDGYVHGRRIEYDEEGNEIGTTWWIHGDSLGVPSNDEPDRGPFDPISQTTQRVFVHPAHDEARIIHVPTSETLVVQRKGEATEQVYASLIEAIDAFNRIVVRWVGFGWTDAVPSFLTRAPEPYALMAYEDPEAGPDDLALRQSWVSNACTDDQRRDGPVLWVWGDGSKNLSAYVDNEEQGVRRDYDTEGRLQVMSHWQKGDKHGLRCRFAKDGGMVWFERYEAGKKVEKVDLPRPKSEPREEQTLSTERVEVSHGAYCPRLAADIEGDSRVLTDADDIDEALEDGELGVAVMLDGLDLEDSDWKPVHALGHCDAFSEVRALTLNSLQHAEAVDLIRWITSGALDAIEHLSMVNCWLYSVSNGTAEALLLALLSRPKLRSLHLNGVMFVGRKSHGTHPLLDTMVATAIQACPNASVQHLDLEHLPQVGDASAAAIATLPHLETLHLHNVSVGDEGFRRLCAMPLRWFTYSYTACGDREGLDNVLHAEVVRQEAKALEDRMAFLFDVDAQDASDRPGDIHALLQEPSTVAFRRLMLTLAGIYAQAPSDFDDALLQVTQGTATWPVGMRSPQPYLINAIVDGELPFALLQPVAALRLFDVVLDSHTQRPADSDVVSQRLRALEAQLREPTAMRLKVLDVSAQAWLDSQACPDYTEGYSMDEVGGFWAAAAQADWLSELEALDLSAGDHGHAFDPTNHDDYITYTGLFGGFGLFKLSDFLRTARCASTLKTLRCRDFGIPSHEDFEGVCLPRLTHLDLSGEGRRAAVTLIQRCELPALKRVVLDRSVLSRFALDVTYDELDEDSQMWLDHDWDVGGQEQLDAQLISDADIQAIIKAAKGVKVQVGGELKRGKIKKHRQVSEAKKYTVTVPW